MLASTRISRSEAQAGDLVFFTSGGSAYHVGIYAGDNMMYDAGPDRYLLQQAGDLDQRGQLRPGLEQAGADLEPVQGRSGPDEEPRRVAGLSFVCPGFIAW